MANLALAFDILARDKASATFNKVGDSADKTGKRIDRAGKSGGAGFGGGISKGVKLAAGSLAGLGLARMFTGFIGDARESAKIGALTNQVIKTTGGAAKITAKQVGDLATAISNKTGADDEAIQSASNLLLTFTNIRNETGKGNDVFNQATQAALDMSTVLGTDAKASAVQLGKALNDPIKGITALSKSGVSFTEQQKEQIKTLVKSGDTLGAQKLILAELGKEFGGAAEAAGTPMDKLRVTLGNLGETVGGALIPKVDQLARFFTGKLIPAATQVYNALFKGDFTGGGPFAEDSAFIANVFAVREAFIKLIAFVKAEVLPRLQTLGSFLMDTVVPALIDLAKFVGRNKDFFVPFALAIGTIVAALKAWAIVQAAINILLVANPLGVVVVALAAVAAALVMAYKRSETFRNVVQTVFKVVGGALLTFVDLWLAGFQKFAEAMSHLPFIGDKFKGVAEGIGRVRDEIKDMKTDLAQLGQKTIKVPVVLQVTATGALGKAARTAVSNKLDRLGRAAGGPVAANQMVMVGEREPEWWVPDRPGRIVNQQQAAQALVGAPAAGGGFQHHGDIIIQKAVQETDPQAVSRAITNRAFLMGFV